jgi:hypothetical protein
MAGRKRHSAEDIVRKLRRAEELAAEGKTGDQIAAELGPCARTAFGSCRGSRGGPRPVPGSRRVSMAALWSTRHNGQAPARPR